MFETLSLDRSGEDTETATIISETTHADGSTTASSVYSGAVDFQPKTGSTVTDPSGINQTVDALLLINPAADGTLPSIAISDGGPTFVATVAGLRYDVIFAAHWNAPPTHLALHLKRGKQRFTETR
ncbi:MAG: hypothetical protein JWM87_735 [Candidatus Eremiobacteraeota bacterium]|nr:hypothetical protein [Candidatus Eremiobacteraeota bacterium]